MEAILAPAKKGVILFSFRSFVKTAFLPRQAKLELFKAFSHFPNHTILWKYDEINEEDAELLSHAPNIRAIKWLPQVDLLNDGRVKVFITHMGLNSYLETAYLVCQWWLSLYSPTRLTTPGVPNE